MEIPQGTSTPAGKKLMAGLISEFGRPQFEPHVTVLGAIGLTEQDALEKFNSACDGLQAYNATVDSVATGTFFYQCVYLLLHPMPEVVEASAHCTGHFGYKSSTRVHVAATQQTTDQQHTSIQLSAIEDWLFCAYMPHLSLLYGDLTDDEKKKAQEKADTLDESINGLSFPITRLALWKTDTQDLTLKSWEKIAECSLIPK